MHSESKFQIVLSWNSHWRPFYIFFLFQIFFLNLTHGYLLLNFWILSVNLKGSLYTPLLLIFFPSSGCNIKSPLFLKIPKSDIKNQKIIRTTNNWCGYIGKIVWRIMIDFWSKWLLSFYFWNENFVFGTTKIQ